MSFNQTAYCQPRDSFSGLCSTDQESNLSSDCSCITCELRLFFLHLQLVTKNSSKEYCWDTWKLDAIQISVSINNIPLEHGHSCLFVYLLSTACSTMTELSSGDRWGLQSWQDFLGSLHWESLPTSCLRDDTFKVCILPACQLGFSPILSISESCNFFWEASLTLGPHSLGSFNSPTSLPILCFSLLTLGTVNNGGIRGGSNPASSGDPKLCESRSMSVLVTTISVVFSMCVDIQFLQACLTLCHTMAVALRAPPSMGYSRQEYWSGLLFPPPGDLPDPGIQLTPPALEANSLLLSHCGRLVFNTVQKYLQTTGLRFWMTSYAENNFRYRTRGFRNSADQNISFVPATVCGHGYKTND